MRSTGPHCAERGMRAPAGAQEATRIRTGADAGLDPGALRPRLRSCGEWRAPSCRTLPTVRRCRAGASVTGPHRGVAARRAPRAGVGHSRCAALIRAMSRGALAISHCAIPHLSIAISSQCAQRLGRVGLASCAVAVYDASPSRASAPGPTRPGASSSDSGVRRVGPEGEATRAVARRLSENRAGTIDSCDAAL